MDVPGVVNASVVIIVPSMVLLTDVAASVDSCTLLVEVASSLVETTALVVETASALFIVVVPWVTSFVDVANEVNVLVTNFVLSSLAIVLAPEGTAVVDDGAELPCASPVVVCVIGSAASLVLPEIDVDDSKVVSLDVVEGIILSLVAFSA